LLARASEHRLLPLSVFLGLVRRGLRDGKPPSVRTMSFTDTTSGELYRLGGEQTTGADGELRGLVLMEPARPFESPMGLLCLGLTPREASVVAELLRDENLVACAHRLGCAPGTVAKHVKNVYAKLSVGSRRELALRLMAHAPNVGAGPAGLP
jgi:DNA-binding CsgD family transcriptional regulator